MAAALALAGAGCATGPGFGGSGSASGDRWADGPFFVPTNHVGVASLPADVRRVAVLPVAAPAELPADAAAALDAVVLSELSRIGRFEVVAVSRAQLRGLAGVESLASTGVLPAGLLERIGRQHGAEAVLLVDVPVFRGFAPVAIGVRAKMASVRDPRLMLWSFDTVFDAAERPVANAARRHAHLAAPAAGGADLTAGILQSPNRFAGYAFAAAFATLPERTTR